MDKVLKSSVSETLKLLGHLHKIQLHLGFTYLAQMQVFLKFRNNI
jgi:hypothetical protein